MSGIFWVQNIKLTSLFLVHNMKLLRGTPPPPIMSTASTPRGNLILLLISHAEISAYNVQRCQPLET